MTTTASLKLEPASFQDADLKQEVSRSPLALTWDRGQLPAATPAPFQQRFRAHTIGHSGTSMVVPSDPKQESQLSASNTFMNRDSKGHENKFVSHTSQSLRMRLPSIKMNSTNQGTENSNFLPHQSSKKRAMTLDSSDSEPEAFVQQRMQIQEAKIRLNAQKMRHEEQKMRHEEQKIRHEEEKIRHEGEALFLEEMKVCIPASAY